MSQFSKDISEWKEKYPFLGDIWELYEEFNKSANSHVKEKDMIRLCEEQATNENSIKDTYNKLCMKLLKNLLLLLTRYRNDYGMYINRCNDFYNWLYHETNPHNLTENILPSIFNLYYSLIQQTDKKYICPYNLYNKDEYKDEKIIELNIFVDNIEKLLNILKNRSHSHYCPCIKYVKNCVETYKYLETNFCTGTNERTHGNEKFCNKLNKFIIHHGYLTKEETIKSEIPSLSSDIDTYTNKCLLEENINQFVSPTDKSLGNSTSVAASTVVGAMVGIPPFLALMYKFTPVGQLFRSRIKTGIAKNIGENELFYRTIENMNNSSDHTRYNVLYGPVRN